MTDSDEHLYSDHYTPPGPGKHVYYRNLLWFLAVFTAFGGVIFDLTSKMMAPYSYSPEWLIPVTSGIAIVLFLAGALSMAIGSPPERGMP